MNIRESHEQRAFENEMAIEKLKICILPDIDQIPE
jgi:hypothetical protein